MIKSYDIADTREVLILKETDWAKKASIVLKIKSRRPRNVQKHIGLYQIPNKNQATAQWNSSILTEL